MRKPSSSAQTRYGHYTGRQLSQISFPLGGIGAGCIGLGGNGRLVDWEIFNKPNKNSLNGYSHFAVKAEAAGQLLDARVLQGDLPPPYSGESIRRFGGFGFGAARETMAGLPHFRKVVFDGRFPVAQLTFDEASFPGQVRLTAFNPFIPLNEDDSSLPAAFFEIEFRNPRPEAVTYTAALTLKNPLPLNTTVDRFRQEGRTALLHFSGSGQAADDPATGDLTVATDAGEVNYQEDWFRGGWFDTLGIFWRDFCRPGPFANRRYPDCGNVQDHGTLAARITVGPQQSGTIRFLLAWNFPNCTNYWTPDKPDCACSDPTACKPKTWKNWYATKFADSAQTALYGLREWDRLQADTLLFQKTLFAASLPAPVLDAISANISILKTPTVMRLEDGSFYGFEGCHGDAGCCEGSCTHVWNYAYALPFLFPRLERSMRNLDYQYNLREDGGMPFRLQLPLDRERSTFRPCADGQFGGVIKTYRDWKISGDSAWLKTLWPKVKASLEFAWHPANPDRWDPEQRGVLTGRQHHTLDMELFGPNSWLTGFYLAALKAGAEMAEACGEPDRAALYRQIFAKGQAWVDQNLFNGEFYYQAVDLKNRAMLEPYAEADKTYWNAEHGELKYQIGDGCGIDQVLAQWHANLCGLGAIFDPAQTRQALAAIYRYNYKPSMREFANFCRVFGLNDEAGTVMFDWPAGHHKPVVPVPYAEETMHGFEYQAAGHMIQEGMVAEGVAVVKAVRDRYDGEKRNPWNEIECGSNYARSMASYALLNAFSCFQFDLTAGRLGFNPVAMPAGRFRCLWSLDPAWGEVVITPTSVELRVLAGRLELKTLSLPFLAGHEIKSVKLGRQSCPCELRNGTLAFAAPVAVTPAHPLKIQIT